MVCLHMGKIINFNRPKKRGEREMARITISDIAKYFIARADEEEVIMTHLKLQKLCFYAQAWSLVFDDKQLFNQPFQAWAHGPVCPQLYQKYKSHSGRQIHVRKGTSFDNDIFSNEQLETLDVVWEAYSRYDAKYLEKLTHKEDPWKLARGSCSPGDSCDTVISQESMKEFYATLQG